MVYQHTKPRGPIAAMYSSPGPVYQLPTLTGAQSHDARSTKGRGPAWLFGVRHGKLTQDSSPGPVHYPSFKVTRYGANGNPVYSIYSRPKTPKIFQVPGPGTYSPEKAGPSAAPASPQHSFGARTRAKSTDGNPAPNTYTLPTLMGRTVEGNKHSAPMWSQTARSYRGGFDEDYKKTPGPGTHNMSDVNCYKGRAPSYSLRPRVEMPGDSSLKPGPGAHFPEKVVKTRKSAPSFSFGMRHSDYIAPLIAAPLDD